MSDLIEQMNPPTSDILGPNKTFGASNTSLNAGDEGIPFESHLQAATASQKSAETQVGELGISSDEAGLNPSQSDESAILIADSALPAADQADVHPELSVDNNGAPSQSLLKSGDPRMLVTSDVDVTPIETPAISAGSNSNILGDGKLATAGPDSTAPALGSRIVSPAPENGDRAVTAFNSEGLGSNLQSVSSDSAAAQYVAPSDLSGELDSGVHSVTVTTSESGDLTAPQQLSIPAVSVSTGTANLEERTLHGAPATTATTVSSQSVDVRQTALSAQNSLNTSAESNKSVGVVAEKDASAMDKLRAGAHEISSAASGRSSVPLNGASAAVNAVQQPLQTAEVVSSVKKSQPSGRVDSLSEAEGDTPVQPRGVAVEASVEAGKNNVTTTPAMLLSGVLAAQRAVDNGESTVQPAISFGNRAAAGGDESDVAVAARDARSQQTSEAVVPSNFNLTSRMDALGVTASLQLSSAEGDSIAGNQPSNMFLAASNGIVAAPNPARTTAGSGLVLAPTVMQMTPDFQDQALVGNVRWMVNEGISNATINVSPGGMGPISVQLTMEGEKMNVAFFAGQAATREALDMAAPRLRDHLQAQGLDQVRVEVNDGRSDNSRNMQQSQAGEKQSADARNKHELENFADENRDEVSVDSDYPLLRSSSSLIDAFV